jgi:putative heme transporter
VAPADRPAEQPPGERRWRPWPSGIVNRDRLVSGGLIAWALLGFLGLIWVAAWFMGHVSLVVIPLVVALFPAALLEPASSFLKRHRFRPALAAATVLGGFLIALVGIISVLAWLIADELDGVVDAVEDGYADIAVWVDERFGIEMPAIEVVLEQLRDWAVGENGLGSEFVTSAAVSTLEWVASVLLGLVALFFYLKDGAKIFAWFTRLFSPRLRDDATEVGNRVWATLGAYFRGQLVVAAVDAFFIGLGLFLLDVPLALPLALLVFFGGLFPVVGAFTAGALAVLVALADQGLVVALIVLALNVAVQQAEGNLLEPLIVGRATKLHPLAVLVALTAGAVTFGILGAFLAVPVVASLKAGLGYLFTRDMARPPDAMPYGPSEPAEAEGVPPPEPDGASTAERLAGPAADRRP